jgi:nucleoside-diphosphate-sugar epimerase
MADDSYGMSKITGEVLGYGYSRRYGCSVHCFRLATIIYPGSDNCESWVSQIDNPEFDLLPGVVSIKDTIWAYVDARDVANAYRLALENDAVQFDIYNIGAEDIFSKEESLVLAKRYYPKCENIATDYFKTNRSRALYDISKAKSVLNYNPQHTWKDYL